MDRAQMDEQQSANNASGSNRDLMPMLEMMSQYQMSNLEVLNERHEDELRFLRNCKQCIKYKKMIKSWFLKYSRKKGLICVL
ncbi:uncharacterized protein LOC110042821 isoform X3 [Orbicella faveolata]|uniref:uncharacterized protein LOC110042821 isoform X3 n=1 Tax=Orbicella faveolata TaxID=48498 RepID=UPI0009E31818|nr:uncharacterized protein LOC110042821 isoform X3 [Orbicella faveolata]